MSTVHTAFPTVFISSLKYLICFNGYYRCNLYSVYYQKWIWSFIFFKTSNLGLPLNSKKLLSFFFPQSSKRNKEMKDFEFSYVLCRSRLSCANITILGSYQLLVLTQMVFNDYMKSFCPCLFNLYLYLSSIIISVESATPLSMHILLILMCFSLRKTYLNSP